MSKLENIKFKIDYSKYKTGGGRFSPIKLIFFDRNKLDSIINCITLDDKVPDYVVFPNIDQKKYHCKHYGQNDKFKSIPLKKVIPTTNSYDDLISTISSNQEKQVFAIDFNVSPLKLYDVVNPKNVITIEEIIKGTNVTITDVEQIKNNEFN